MKYINTIFLLLSLLGLKTVRIVTFKNVFTEGINMSKQHLSFQHSTLCPLPGSAQGQVGWSSEQPGLGEDVPAHGRGVGTRRALRSLPTQTIL